MSEKETDYGVWPKMADMLTTKRTVHNGMVLVPRKPTKAMLRAAAKAMSPEKRPTKDWMSVSEKHAYRYEIMIKAYLEESDE